MKFCSYEIILIILIEFRFTNFELKTQKIAQSSGGGHTVKNRVPALTLYKFFLPTKPNGIQKSFYS